MPPIRTVIGASISKPGISHGLGGDARIIHPTAGRGVALVGLARLQHHAVPFDADRIAAAVKDDARKADTGVVAGSDEVG
jgi:hypothetical protein